MTDDTTLAESPPDDDFVDVPSFITPRPDEGTTDESAVLAVAEIAPPLDLPAMPGDDEFRAIATMARVLADSNLVPSALRRKPHDVAMILLTGRELGIAPTAALRSCYVVDGKVTLAPALKQAIVTDRGLGKLRPAPGNDAEKATWIAFEPDGEGGWNEAGRLTLTMDEMRTAQNGSRGLLVDKDNWKSYPARMLSARCRGWLIDDIWPEAAFGLYSPDEVGAFTDENGEPIDVTSYENVPDGFAPRGAAAPPAPIDPADAEGFRVRVAGLPEGAKATAVTMFEERKIPLPLSEAAAAKVGIIGAIIGGLESRAQNGEWGDWTQPKWAAGYCDDCEQTPCACPAPEGEPSLLDD